MIREANLEDLKDINELGAEMLPNFTKTYNISYYIEDKNYIILVNSDKIVNAFLLVLRNYDSFDIELIYVREEMRNKKIATRLLEFFEKNYVSPKSEIFLEVAVNNNKAIALYKKLGFVIINIRKKYYENIDAYIMKKVI